MALVFTSDSFRFALVVTAAIFLRFCSAAPTKTEPEPWWYSPCTSKIEKLPERHERSTKVHLEHVQRALNNFLYKLKTFSRDIQKIYPKIQRSAKKIRYGKIKSLPLKKLLKPIVNSTTTQLEKLVSFHRALQYFAGHLDHLRKIEVTSFASDFKEEARRTSYTNIVDSLKQLLCEVQDGFENEKGLTKISPKKMKIRIPVHNVKLTYAQLYDSDMLKKMNSFFKKVKKNIFRAIKSKKRNKSVVNKTKRTSS